MNKPFYEFLALFLSWASERPGRVVVTEDDNMTHDVLFETLPDHKCVESSDNYGCSSSKGKHHVFDRAFMVSVGSDGKILDIDDAPFYNGAS